MAAAVRLLDRATFRVGSEAYADRNGSFGLATIRKSHVTDRGIGAGVRLHREGRHPSQFTRVDDPLARAAVRPAEAAAHRGAWSCSPTARVTAGATFGPATSTPTSRTSSARSTPRRTSERGTRPCSPPRSSPGARRRAFRDVQAAAGRGDRSPRRRTSRQHPGRVSRLLHRPARVRSIPRREHRRAVAHENGTLPDDDEARFVLEAAVLELLEGNSRSAAA